MRNFEYTSYREIMRSSSLLAGASIANVVLGIIRTKVVALILGPSALGLIGLYTQTMGAAATVFGLGFGNAGTREVANAAGRDDDKAMASARRALLLGTLILASSGVIAIWAARAQLAILILGDGRRASDVGWLAIGVALIIISASQAALLNGARHIKYLSAATLLSSVIYTCIGLSTVYVWGESALIAFVLLGPLSMCFAQWVFVIRVPGQVGKIHAADFRNLGAVLGFGSYFMLGHVVGTAAHLFVRSLVLRQLGPDQLGYHHAAWTISMTYVGFVLSSMSTDYYPRLTAAIGSSHVARLINEQAEVALLLAVPILLLASAVAPLILHLLYSVEFQFAAPLLRWQILGDTLKIIGWPLSFLLLASGSGRLYLLTEILAAIVLVGVSWGLISWMGIEAAGVGYCAMYASYLPLMVFLAYRRYGFRWSPAVGLLVIVALMSVASEFVITRWLDDLGAIFGIVCAGCFGLYSARRLLSMVKAPAL